MSERKARTIRVNSLREDDIFSILYCDLTKILTNLGTLRFKSLLDILWFKALKLSSSKLEALSRHQLEMKIPHVSTGPKDTLCFQNWTTGHDVRQNSEFGYAACLLSSKAGSQPPDRLWFKLEDKTVVKSHIPTCIQTDNLVLASRAKCHV